MCVCVCAHKVIQFNLIINEIKKIVIFRLNSVLLLLAKISLIGINLK